MELHLGHRPGCIGRIVELHGRYYAAAAGFGVDFESRVASELADFCRRYQPGRDGLWLAMDGERIEGSIAIDGSHAAEDGAHLRWFIVSEAARGSGAGEALLRTALAFCDERGYARCHLWTFDSLHAAAHLYRKHGFEVLRTERGTQWGREVNEQLLQRPAPGAWHRHPGSRTGG